MTKSASISGGRGMQTALDGLRRRQGRPAGQCRTLWHAAHAFPARSPPGPPGSYEGNSFSANRESSEMMGDESSQHSLSFVSGMKVTVSHAC